MCACVCAILGSSSRNQEQSQEERCNFIFCLAFFVVLCAAAVHLYHTISFSRCGSNSNRTSRPSFCDSYKRCFCVCVCAYVCANLNTSWTIPTHTCSEFQKDPRAQQRYNGSGHYMGSYKQEHTRSPFQQAVPPGFHVNHIPNGNVANNIESTVPHPAPPPSWRYTCVQSTE